MKPQLGVWQYRRPTRRQRWWNALRDFPYLLADGIGDDADPAFLRRLMFAVFLMFGLAVAIWLLAWWLR